MDVKQLKFLLRLISKPDYQASITELKPTSGTRASERDKICRELRALNLVEAPEEVTKLKIEPAGKALLEADAAELPLSKDELKALKASAKGTINPSDTRIPTDTRQSVIQALVERGLISALKTQLKEVRLTERGKEFLLYEYNPSGPGNTNLTQDLLAIFLNFFRQQMKKPQSSAVRTEPSLPAFADKPSDEQILQAIAELDRTLGTDNYLPIFHLRSKLQPPLFREELDEALYRLEKNDQIQLSTLQEVSSYTPEQVQAGIPQDIGGPLFFIIVN
ncbi:hypothetical protein [Oscillatoria salina]|uniref:hypothetical protein n=1 Tax=Oscillatoria salina TaxID=331517 RepID=UPI0013BD03F0|nr:hypothetical protein [Oscillatoria salina]MBZ8183299.1 hypothetical protein [Oscillatoria salina IIICB1]NET87100.1 hypothetical protein [Kamptonema sp. SIO1D9]